MSESAQEKATQETGVPPVPGHQGGAPPVGESAEGKRTRAADEVASGHPDKIEPRAGRDS
jgi:hypothetical protein